MFVHTHTVIYVHMYVQVASAVEMLTFMVHADQETQTESENTRQTMPKTVLRTRLHYARILRLCDPVLASYCSLGVRKLAGFAEEGGWPGTR